MRYFKISFLFLFILLTASISTYADEAIKGKTTNVENIGDSQSYWEDVMNAIIQVESRGITTARNGSSLGVLQITPILVAECNNILKRKGSKKRYKLSDRLSVKKSKEMFVIIMNRYNKTKTAIEACRIWSGGPYCKKIRQSYWRKFLKYYKK